MGLLGIGGELEGVKHARKAGLLGCFMFPSEHVTSLIFMLPSCRQLIVKTQQ